MAINTGVNASKAVGFGLLSSPSGVSASKAVGYGLLSSPSGVSASKVVVYSLLENIGLGVDTAKLVAYALLVSATSPSSNSAFAGATSSGSGNVPFAF